MRILVVCEYGINRSVTIASQLKFLGHDTISTGTNMTTRETMDMLSEWADRIIIVEPYMNTFIRAKDRDKIRLWDTGPDMYPRPYNKALLEKVRQFIKYNAKDLEEHDHAAV